MKIVPVGGVEPPFEPCRARDGVGCQLAVLSHYFYLLHVGCDVYAFTDAPVCLVFKIHVFAYPDKLCLDNNLVFCWLKNRC